MRNYVRCYSLCLVCCPWVSVSVAEETSRPNILLIVADDLGYSDLGAYGGEIDTPNLDQLAEAGMRLSNFHATPSCSPTRAAMLSGTDNHIAGMGAMAERLPFSPELSGRPGYEGYLNNRVLSLASLLKDAGYHTNMAGKWHLGKAENQWPDKRGFEKSFALLDGGASHFADRLPITSSSRTPRYVHNGLPVENLPENFYSSEYYASQIIRDINAQSEENKPFFAYLSFTAPHWPLQAPDTWLEKYRGQYDAGWDVLRSRRVASMRKNDLLAEDIETFPRLATVSPWEKLSPTAKQVEARRMELYAAMVSNMDHQIGRLLDYLKESGQYENTFILFLSDNGPDGVAWDMVTDHNYWVSATFDNRYGNMGRPGSFVWLGAGWAQVSALPHRMYKAYMAEGGIRVPAIASWPGNIEAGRRGDGYLSVVDIMPTFLQLAAKSHLHHRDQGDEMSPMTGKSALPYLMGSADHIYGDRDAVGMELHGQRVLIMGEWKLLWMWKPNGTGAWQLYNLTQDPAELHDLALSEPDRLEDMSQAWDEYARETGVYVYTEEKRVFKPIRR